MYRIQPLRSARRIGPLIAFSMLAGVLGARPAAADVVLSVTSASVTEPGQTAEICVLLDSGGQAVAGTQNDLVWDGTCATLTDPSFSCRANPAHGKQLNAALPPGTDFTMRAFVLSLADTTTINTTELFCCSFQSELTEPGSSCPINITRVGASTPDGQALPTRSGGPGQISFAGSARGPLGRDRSTRDRPAAAVGGNVPAADESAGVAGGEPVDTGGSGGAASAGPVVLQGGGVRAPDAPLPAGAAAAPPPATDGTPTPGAATVGALAGERPASVQPPVVVAQGAGPGRAEESPGATPPTEAVTGETPAPGAATSPSPGTPAETPATPAPTTAKATSAPTKEPTTATSPQPTRPSEDDGGWGCQIAPRGTALAVALLGLFAVAIALLGRLQASRAAARHRPSNDTRRN